MIPASSAPESGKNVGMASASAAVTMRSVCYLHAVRRLLSVSRTLAAKQKTRAGNRLAKRPPIVSNRPFSKRKSFETRFSRLFHAFLNRAPSVPSPRIATSPAPTPLGHRLSICRTWPSSPLLPLLIHDARAYRRALTASTAPTSTPAAPRDRPRCLATA